MLEDAKTNGIKTNTEQLLQVCCLLMQMADIKAEELNVTIPVVLDNGYYWGVAAITTDFSTLGISKLESAIDVDTVTYEAGVTGLLI